MLQSQSPPGHFAAGRHRPASGHTPPPPPDHILPCPRCDSTNTKFCYYNNYSLAQPRHFCKKCRRYWTKGGSLRNVPIGGGCRKNKLLKPSTGPAHDDSDPAPLSTCSSLQFSRSSASHAASNPFGLDFYPAQECSGIYGSFSQPCVLSNLPSFDTSISAIAYYPSSHSMKQETDMLYKSCSFNSLFAEGSTAGSLNLAAMEDQISTYNTSRESYDETLGLELAQSRVPYHKLTAMQLLNSVQNGGQIAGEHLISLLPDFVSGVASSSDQSYMETGRPVPDQSPAGSAVGPIF